MKINSLLIDLQYESLLVSQHREAFDQFIVRLREMACLDDAPKLCKGSFALLLSDVSDLINGLGSSVSAMFNGLAKEQRDGICCAFGILLVDLANGVCNISPERNGDNLAVAPPFPRSYQKSSQ
jgi:hypothetical protein